MEKESYMYPKRASMFIRIQLSLSGKDKRSIGAKEK